MILSVVMLGAAGVALALSVVLGLRGGAKGEGGEAGENHTHGRVLRLLSL